MYPYRAVIFDLDGVITRTALVHSKAWKRMFDTYLLNRQKKYGELFREFTHEKDYLEFVDGKTRYEGVSSFLNFRGIELPFGDPCDDPSTETVCGLGNLKNDVFHQVLEQEGVEVYESSISLIHALRKQGIVLAVASSSKNCMEILNIAGISDLFETVVDGNSIQQKGLMGKPEPYIFLTAAEQLRCKPGETVVIEDAVSGIQAGFKGNFGLTLGIAREKNADELYEAGADKVVNDLEECTPDLIGTWLNNAAALRGWSLNYYGYSPLKERSRETILSTGNGLMASRGSMEETLPGPWHYPGTYAAGVYNSLITKLDGLQLRHDELVNLPDWLHCSFGTTDKDFFSPDTWTIHELKRSLNLLHGKLSGRLHCSNPQGETFLVETERYWNMAAPRTASMVYRITSLNYDGDVHFRSVLRGNVENKGVDRYKELNSKHLEFIEAVGDANFCSLKCRTNQSQIEIEAETFLQCETDLQMLEPDIKHIIENESIISSFLVPVRKGQCLSVTRNLRMKISSQKGSAAEHHETGHDLETKEDLPLSLQHEQAWETVWQEMDIEIQGDRISQLLLRLNLYHLLVSYSPNCAGLDTGLMARGLHGEAYRGHVFWDEVFILPFYCLHFPEAAYSSLLYRYRRLDRARENAVKHGLPGALFPWQSASEGTEETPQFHLNPVSGHWDEDLSSRQWHINLAIAWNITEYFRYTGDLSFLLNFGLEMYLEICRFQAGISSWDEERRRYVIRGVMGPDEFHEKYPATSRPGLDNNAYTNLMTAWCLGKLSFIRTAAGEAGWKSVTEKIKFTESEYEESLRIGSFIYLPIDSEGIIEQFEGYSKLAELDWAVYKTQYPDIQRLDRILKAEGKSPDHFKVSKQADLLMAFYLLGKKETGRLLHNLSYSLPEGYFEKNFDYYYRRTSHGSTLSELVHAVLAFHAGRDIIAKHHFRRALGSDYYDIQGGTTAEGIHCGVMAGSIMAVYHCFAGLSFENDRPVIRPRLPDDWPALKFNFQFKGDHYRVEINEFTNSITKSGEYAR